LGALFIKLNIRMSAFRQRSRLSQWPITEVAVVTAVTLLASFGSDYLRADTGMLIGALFAECDGSGADSMGLCSCAPVLAAVCDVRLTARGRCGRADFASRVILGLLVACFVKLLLTVFTFGTKVCHHLPLPVPSGTSGSVRACRSPPVCSSRRWRWVPVSAARSALPCRCWSSACDPPPPRAHG
jgi:hypothetical protein